MKKVCAFIIIILLVIFLAGSGCAEKRASMPVSENKEKEFEGRQITICAGDLAEYYERKGLKVLNYLRCGEIFKPGDTIFEAEGDIKPVFRFWRVSRLF